MNTVLKSLIAGNDLSQEQAASLAESLCDGRLPDAMVGALLSALSAKGESVDEIAAFARVLRDRARKPALSPRPDLLVDIVGTGGDGSGSLNISTAAALVAAGAGVPVAKHGNRAVSGRCGAADVLEALAVPLGTDDRELSESLRVSQFAFLYAPAHHPTLAALAPVRKSLGVRTVFNLLGPLVNPTQPTHAVIGACSPDIGRKLARVVRMLGMKRCFVVCSNNGWDEATTASPFRIIEAHADGPEIRESVRNASDYGLTIAPEDALIGGDAAANAAALRELLRGRQSPFRDAVTMTAALALEVTGVAQSPTEAIRAVAAAIDDGRAARVLETVAGLRRSAGAAL